MLTQARSFKRITPTLFLDHPRPKPLHPIVTSTPHHFPFHPPTGHIHPLQSSHLKTNPLDEEEENQLVWEPSLDEPATPAEWGAMGAFGG